MSYLASSGTAVMRQTKTSVGGAVEMLGLSPTAGGNAKRRGHRGKQRGSSPERYTQTWQVPWHFPWRVDNPEE